MNRLPGWALTIVVVMTAMCAAAHVMPQPTPTPPSPAVSVPALSGGAPSIDALIDRLLAAVAVKDAKGLHALRVTEDEYKTVVVPWTVAPGQPPRQTTEKTNAYMWRALDTRSKYFVQALLDEFGGLKLTPTAHSFTKDPQTFAGYTAFGKLKLDVVEKDGRKGILKSGTIVEINGQYKFIGLNWDD